MSGSENACESSLAVERVESPGKRNADSLRVALVTHNASLRMGGEAALALHYFRELNAQGVEVYLIAHERNREELEQLYPGRSGQIYLARESLLDTLIWRIGRRLPNRLYRATFGLFLGLRVQAHQARIIRKLVSDHGVIVVHQVAPVSPAEPSLIHRVGAPVVIGPMNGGVDLPRTFRRRESVLSRMVVHAGRHLRHVASRIFPGKPRASVVIAANERTVATLPRGCHAAGVIRMPEIGVDLRDWSGERADRAGDAEVRFIFVGRLVDWKAVDLLLRAWAASRSQFPGKLTIAGDGEARAELESLTDALGVRDSVEFAGFLDVKRCAELMARSDVLVLPSLRECGGAVILEAMAMRLPVIASDWAGPAEHVDTSCGILVPVDSSEEYVPRLADAMVRLARCPELRIRMGDAGRRRIEEHYDWGRKVDRMIDIYLRVLEQDRRPGGPSGPESRPGGRRSFGDAT